MQAHHLIILVSLPTLVSGASHARQQQHPPRVTSLAFDHSSASKAQTLSRVLIAVVSRVDLLHLWFRQDVLLQSERGESFKQMRPTSFAMHRQSCFSISSHGLYALENSPC
ncbi:hypothetical protein BCR37DRAFT_383371 [Protomyces lactucae-debilis]|uniref:Secreted protein n=1 Tax=Protomyces lactucae-debilis TaxID=2754530 RepID=A0A1Y2EYN1_PROLT|nr:uncharacterized protein BCR37DRAFT_383371 [Protomyces lactucae-debilis]ORY76709.1 hypothetical protein BCR37DRAFT_383371 [Protomyces lactucae-debilis]